MLTKTDSLIKIDQRLFHTGDLALLWNLNNPHSVRVAASRYIKNGIFTPVQRGLYSTVPLSKLDAYELGASILHSYCYVSTETILAKEGIISQEPVSVTLISGKSKMFEAADHSYISRKMKNMALFNPEGIITVDNHYEATPERAVADMLYYDPTYYFDLPNRIDWKRVREIQKKVRYK
jgi:predicted transcriptional regulator of viral defense system